MRKIIATFLVLSSFALGATISNAYSFWYSGGFSPVSTDVHCNQNLMNETKLAISSACLEWNSAGAGSLVFRGNDTSNNAYPNKNNSNDFTFGLRGSNSYLMETNPTSTFFSTLKEVDIDINTSYAWANNGDSMCYDIRSGATHEIGHLLGLGHSTVTSATMFNEMGKGEISMRTIEQDDKNGINDIY